MVTWVEHLQNRGKSASSGGAVNSASAGSSEMPKAACFPIDRLIDPDCYIFNKLDEDEVAEHELLEKWVDWLDNQGKLSALQEFYAKFMVDRGHPNSLSDMNDALTALSEAGFALSRMSFGYWDDQSHVDIDLPYCLK